jgi:hypothetical protein
LGQNQHRSDDAWTTGAGLLMHYTSSKADHEPSRGTHFKLDEGRRFAGTLPNGEVVLQRRIR